MPCCPCSPKSHQVVTAGRLGQGHLGVFSGLLGLVRFLFAECGPLRPQTRRDERWELGMRAAGSGAGSEVFEGWARLGWGWVMWEH